MNIALEADIYDNIDSTYTLDTKVMDDIGGSGDPTRSGYISIFTTPSTIKDGVISAIVPVMSHVDHTERSVRVFIIKCGIADPRGSPPRQCAEHIIEDCAHLGCRPLLCAYLIQASGGQTPVYLERAFAFHRVLAELKDVCQAELQLIKATHFSPLLLRR